ncbi:MAG: hypothetical protein WKF41_05785 [Gaiellaceae bacterium]
MSAALLTARPIVQLDRKKLVGGKNREFAAQHLDGAKANGLTYVHGTFANIIVAESPKRRNEA